MATTKATTTRSLFRRTTTVTAQLDASPAAVWQRLTDAAGFAGWNSTVTSLEGPIEQGRRLRITTPTATRAFTPTVTELKAPRRMVWAEGQVPFFSGRRVFELTPRDGGTTFTMTETLTGVMLPLAARSLPDFAPIFDTYVADLASAVAHGTTADVTVTVTPDVISDVISDATPERN